MSSSQLPSTFTLISSDKISVPVSRTHLCSYSSTFRDLLALPSGSESKGTCDVSETGNNLKLFVTAIGGEEKKYTLEELKVLARMADKYDTWCLKILVGKEALKLCDKSPLEVYSLAASLNDEFVAEAAARASFRIDSIEWGRSKTPLSCDYHWWLRSERFRLARLNNGRIALAGAMVKNCSTNHTFGVDSAKSSWGGIALDVLSDLKLSQDVAATLAARLNSRVQEWSGCHPCASEIKKAAERVQNTWAKLESDLKF